MGHVHTNPDIFKTAYIFLHKSAFLPHEIDQSETTLACEQTLFGANCPQAKTAFFLNHPGGGVGGGGYLGYFAGYVPLASQSPYPIIVYSVANYSPFFRLNEEHFTFQLQYKHSGTFANRKYEELSHPKKSENMRPHSSNSVKNATPL